MGLHTDTYDDDEIAREKRKARELRRTAWWRKKIASGVCFYCGRKVRPGDLTMDHRIPLGRGGTSDRINIVAACKECNNKKKHLLPTEWEEYMSSLKSK
ncbi:MAG: HNH endonuclease [Spirochaetes bacterium]|nr:HNH endonuclease [Spirochaetota bacterium]